MGPGRFSGSPGVWIAPTVTPASHLPLSGHLFRTCRSNQCLPDCLTIIVVIRLTPVVFVFASFFKYLPCLCLLVLVSLVHFLCAGFLMPVSTPMVGFLSSACSTYLPVYTNLEIPLTFSVPPGFSSRSSTNSSCT